MAERLEVLDGTGMPGIPFRLYSGGDPAECARRAGQSIEVLFRDYAKFLDGVREQAGCLIEQSMRAKGA
ncbi:hypothetical protein [Streptomyces capitiformicae]|uniref:Uncharacterized protein n=1 Tax=Streptomyces capitiformicae TaxID=2014920 RepID=A0A918ZCT5_9ACTN|nr:hypothetical protein [Streptomyces capitiformicae]GHE44685.1 hypothetical protein GCM10017771_64880 [Streptomyces capitiformicae]